MFFPDLRTLTVMAVPLLAAVTIHEVSHGLVAYRLGDPTPKLAGRLSLNPIKHLDLFGTLAFILTQAIGWAKPVPINPRYFKNPKQDMIWVALAGPVSNLLLATLFALMLKFLPYFLYPLSLFGRRSVVFFGKPLVLMFALGIQLNIGLAIFNLLPIPPLDGSRILFGLLPPKMAYSYLRLEPYGFIILLLLIFTGVIQKIILPAILYLSSILQGGLL